MKAVGRKQKATPAIRPHWYGCIVEGRYLPSQWRCDHFHSSHGDARNCAKKKLIELSAEKVSA
jgi:hypothetical protein